MPRYAIVDASSSASRVVRGRMARAVAALRAQCVLEVT